MDMFMNMTSNVSNWWGSGEKKGNDNKEKKDGEASDQSVIAGDPTSDTTAATAEEPKPAAEEGSPPTSEADSASSHGGGSAEASPTAEEAPEDIGGEKSGKIGSMGTAIAGNINEVSTKAIEGAKSIGSFLFSVANKAGKTVQETAKQIKHTVEENSILSDFNKEQEAFVKEKGQQQTEAAVAPWVGYPEEDLKQQILSLSQDRRNFLRSPPSGVQFTFDYNTMYPIAMATLNEDPSLKDMRFELVPKLVNEETFWRNYFYRVSLIKQSTQLSSLAHETSNIRSVDDHDKGDDVPDVPDSPSREFVSDSFQTGDIDKAELLKGMKQLGMENKGRQEDEWEKELQKELQEYEVVNEGSSSQMDDNEWEKEIQQMLDSELKDKP